MMGKGIIRVLYFSPTHTTRTVVRLTSRILSSELGWPVEETDWTPPDSPGDGAVRRDGGFAGFGVPYTLEGCRPCWRSRCPV